MSQDNKNTTKKEHSFYKEAKKSWMQDDPAVVRKKVAKTTFKVFKWLGGIYLLIAAVWGCVQGFIISTSNYVGRGLETYMTYDDVISNFYQSEENIIYQVQTNAYDSTEGEDGEVDADGNNSDLHGNGETDDNGYINTEGLAPLPFMMENPEYGKVVYAESETDGLWYQMTVSGNTVIATGTGLTDDEISDLMLVDPLVVKARDVNGNNGSLDVDTDYNGTTDDVWYFYTNIQPYAYIKPAQFKYLMGAYQVPTYAFQASLLDPFFATSYLNKLDSTSDSIADADQNVNTQFNATSTTEYMTMPTNSWYRASYDVFNAQVASTEGLTSDNATWTSAEQDAGEEFDGDGVSDPVWKIVDKTADTDENLDADDKYNYVMKTPTAGATEGSQASPTVAHATSGTINQVVTYTNDSDDDGIVETYYKYNPDYYFVPAVVTTSNQTTIDQHYNTPWAIADWSAFEVVSLNTTGDNVTIDGSVSGDTANDSTADENLYNSYMHDIEQLYFMVNSYDFITQGQDDTNNNGTSLAEVALYHESDDTVLLDGTDAWQTVYDNAEASHTAGDITHAQWTSLQAELTKVSTYQSSLAVYSNYSAADYDNTDLGVTSTPTQIEQVYGASVMIIPYTSGAQVALPDKLAFNISNSFRNNDYYKYSGYGGDDKTANAGWMLLDEDLTSNSNNDQNLYQFYDDSGNALDAYLYGDQKTINKGVVKYQDTDNDGTWDTIGESYYGNEPNTPEYYIGEESMDSDIASQQLTVLESQIAYYATGYADYNGNGVKDAGTETDNAKAANYYQSLIDHYEYTIGEDTYTVAPFTADFTGISSLDETGLYFAQGGSGYNTPDEQKGSSVQPTTYVYNDAGNLVTYNNIEYNGALDLSAKAASISNYDNTDRYSMVSWGEAWAWGGPYYGTFVWPLSKLSMWVQSWLPYETMGIWSVILGVFLIVFMLRGLAAVFSYRKKNSTLKMQELSTQVANIKAKYEPYKDNKQMKQRMQMEIQALYRKHGVNPFQSMSTLLITMPIFLALWTIIGAIPVYKIASVGLFTFAVNPLSGMFGTGGGVGVIYMLLATAIISVQIISSKMPTWLAKKRKGIKVLDEATKQQEKKSNRTMTIMLVVFVILGLTIPSLLGLYWVFSGLFSMSQAVVQHMLIERKARRKAIAHQNEKKHTMKNTEHVVDVTVEVDKAKA